MTRLLCAMGIHRWGLWEKYARRDYRPDGAGKVSDSAEIYIRHCECCGCPEMKEVRV